MVTLRKYGEKYNVTFCQFCGLSSDVKPVDKWQNLTIANGSEFIEMDTGITYKYDADNQEWKEDGD